MELETLTRDDALWLMSREPVGRVIYTVGGLPAVTPVNFALVDGTIVIRTVPGSRLATAIDDSVVAFQVDEIDATSHTGWSVTVIGQANEVRDRAEISRLTGLVHPWAEGPRNQVIQIRADLVTGRRLVSNADGDSIIQFSG
ncbi:MAG: pyridoxamine 5'-phosphate oxidase family protein [Actinomycetes bacterium]|jgi:nitroimidazol reductase NimA-like FMN-containing flavoprotein (pyridoxamine 5'-phosphate oxidase superfamily)